MSFNISDVQLVYPVIAALNSASKIIGSDNWEEKGYSQQEFLSELYYPLKNELGLIPEIDAFATRNQREMNNFLNKYHFRKKVSLNGGISLASTINLPLGFQKPGEVCGIRMGGELCTAVRLSGMKNSNDEIIQNVLQPIALKVNQNGISSKSKYDGESLKITDSKKIKSHLKINKPFLLWIERAGLTLPIFAGYISTNHWRSPGKLL